MRLFVGIPLAETVRAELDRVVARMKPKLAGWRWSPPESWHITLQFLGNASPEQYAQLISQLGAIQSPRAPIELGCLDLFDRAGVFFVDVQVLPALAALQKKVESATAPCGFVAEPRPYHPHITLARLKGGKRGAGPRSPGLKPPQQLPSFAASEFVLYESFLSSEGSHYEVRAHFSLI